MENSQIRNQPGFTLLEVIVALAVLSVSLAVLLRIFSGSATVAMITDDYYKALQIAESKMALLQSESSGNAVKRGELENKYRWKASVSKYQIPINHPLFQFDLVEEEELLTPYQYDVTVSWGGSEEKQIRLYTIRLGADQQ